MKKLDKLILKSYLGPLALTFSISMFVLLLQFLWQQMEKIIGKGLEWTIWFKIIAYACATVVPMALPITVLLASIMTLGNFGERYELVAMKSSGVSLWRVLRPLIFLSLILSFLAFWFSNNIMPQATESLKVITYEVGMKKPTLNIRENEFYSDINNYVIRIGKKDNKGENLSNIIIYDHSKDLGNLNVTTAQSGQMHSEDNGNTLVFNLHNGFTVEEDISGENYFNRPFMRVYFKEHLVRIDVSDFAFAETDKDRYKGHYKAMNLLQLIRQIDTLRQQNLNFNRYTLKTLSQRAFIAADNKASAQSYLIDSSYNALTKVQKQRVDNYIKSSVIQMQADVKSYGFKNADDEQQIVLHKMEMHRKFTLSAACLILFFIGAPLGALIRKGGIGMPIVVSIIAFLVYYLIGMLCEKLIKEGTLSPFVGMWLSSMIFLAIGIFLTAKATSESPILNSEQWANRATNLWNKLTKSKKKPITSNEDFTDML